jgi:hypothetical protein
MKIFAISVLVAAFSTACAASEQTEPRTVCNDTATPAPSTPVARVPGNKEAEAKELLQLMSIDSMMGLMMDQYRTLLPQVPPDLWE